MADSYTGQITLFAGTFAPVDWHFCDGSILQVSQYQALYSLLGNIYGGTAPNTFALPDLRGAVPMGTGVPVANSGRATITLGQKGGSTTTTLTAAQLPAHTHAWSQSTTPAPTINLTTAATKATYTIPATTNNGSLTSTPTNATYLTKGEAGGDDANIYAQGVTSPEVQMPGGTVSIPAASVTGSIVISGTNAATGTSAPITITTVSPFLGLNYIICLNGIYPQRP